MPPTNLEDLTATPLPLLPPRSADSHKGDYGRALLIGGSRGMSGAIALAGKAALRSGAGLVMLAIPESIQNIVASIEPSYMTYPLSEDDGQIASSEAPALSSIDSATALAIGPGLGRAEALQDLVENLYRVAPRPLVVDADALYALARRPNAFKNPPAPRVLTPHPGEFEPLAMAVTGDWDAARNAKTGNDMQRQSAAINLAKHDPAGRTVVVLKGHQTVITDGHRYSINQTGNPGMATGGTGDVLTGIITALLCQGLAPFDAARLGAHVHGLAGDLAANDFGQVSMIASDLIDYLPKAFRAVVG
jgi:hydroxyethylthiazole kinase-like uncharacterized protein yjeF